MSEREGEWSEIKPNWGAAQVALVSLTNLSLSAMGSHSRMHIKQKKTMVPNIYYIQQ